MTSIFIFGGVLIVHLALFLGLVWFFQERIAFQPPGPPFPNTAGTRRIDYFAQDGQPLLAYLIGLAGPADPPGQAGRLLLCFHGNADLAARRIGWAENVARITGFSVLLAEYRGYMGLPGRSSYESSRHDSEAAFVLACDSLDFSSDNIAFYGHSLGTAIAAELAVRHLPLALVLESPFTSARDMGRRIIGWRPVQLAWDVISRFHFDTVACVASIRAPVWVAHGDEDRLIPSEMGRRVFAAAKVKGEMLLIPGASHSDVAGLGGDSYWRWMESALRPPKIASPAHARQHVHPQP